MAATAERRPESAKGTVIVPDRFLRRWDPVTIFLATDQGPAGGGPEDHPERFVTLSPPHPGAFAWLDARTLQFRPAEPWPPLSRFVWKAGAKTTTLATLMVMPTASFPANGAENLERIDAVTLTFPEPLDPGDLARMTTIELRPLPGIGAHSRAGSPRARSRSSRSTARRFRRPPTTFCLSRIRSRSERRRSSTSASASRTRRRNRSGRSPSRRRRRSRSRARGPARRAIR